MVMVHCRCCGKVIHETALACPHCGGPQVAADPQLRDKGRPIWVSIVSLVLGIFCCLMLFDDSEWDLDTKVGLLMFSLGGLAFGAGSLANQQAGRGLAIAGVVLSAIAFLAGLGLLVG
jgi:hypothetical protein